MTRLLARLNDFATAQRADYTVYEVDDDGRERAIGRMYPGAGARLDKWLWALEGFGSRLAETREEAMAALKAEWERRTT